MTEAKKCIKSLAVFYFLMALEIIPVTGIIPLRFPTDSLSSLYLLFLAIWLVVSVYMKVSGRKYLKKAIVSLSLMIFLMVFFRALKYTVFGPVSALGRHCWYLYYIPMLFIPTLLFFEALFIYAKEEQTVMKRWE